MHDPKLKLQASPALSAVLLRHDGSGWPDAVRAGPVQNYGQWQPDSVGRTSLAPAPEKCTKCNIVIVKLIRVTSSSIEARIEWPRIRSFYEKKPIIYHSCLSVHIFYLGCNLSCIHVFMHIYYLGCHL